MSYLVANPEDRFSQDEAPLHVRLLNHQLHNVKVAFS